ARECSLARCRSGRRWIGPWEGAEASPRPKSVSSNAGLALVLDSPNTAVRARPRAATRRHAPPRAWPSQRPARFRDTEDSLGLLLERRVKRSMKRHAVLVRTLLLLVVLAFVAWTGWDLAVRWQQSPAVVPHVGWVLLSVDAVALFLAAMLGRYAPAKVGMPAILLSRAKSVSITPALAGSSMLLVLLVYTLLGTGLGMGTLAASHRIAPPQLQALQGG